MQKEMIRTRKESREFDDSAAHLHLARMRKKELRGGRLSKAERKARNAAAHAFDA